MIVEMRTLAEAAKVATLTGGVQLAQAKDPTKPSRRVQLSDLETHRDQLESVSVLFKVFDDEGNPLESGWRIQGGSFEVEWPKEPEPGSSSTAITMRPQTSATGRVMPVHPWPEEPMEVQDPRGPGRGR